MKVFLQKSKGKLIFLGIILIIALFWFLTCARIRTISISIDREQVGYVVVNPGGAGPVKVSYAEHQKAVDDFIDMLEGEYQYVRLWRRGRSDGGGPDGIQILDSRGAVVGQIYYQGSRILVATAWDEFYLAYQNPDKLLDMSEFNAYAKELREKNKPNY